MNTELFIAKRLYKGNQKKKKRVSTPAVSIAIAGIALGLVVMILSVSIVIGFKKEIRGKVIGFGSHIQITSFGDNNSYELNPIAVSDSLMSLITANSEIRHVQPYIIKPGIIKTDENFQGIVLKGVDDNYDWEFFKKNMVEGDIINADDTSGVNQAIISKDIADKLHLKLGDRFTTYFVQDPIRARRFDIKGIYQTNFEDYDKLYILTDMSLLAKLNQWDDDYASGLEVLVKDYNQLDLTTQNLFFDMASHRDKLDNTLYARSIKDINPIIFDWLNLLDMNVWIIIILMLVVSGFTMISGLLIIILERTNMIGILKAVGTRDFNIRKIFLYLSSFLILKGLFWGNIIALIICFAQKYLHIIKLNPEVYYTSYVPIDINLWNILIINVGTLIVSMLMMIGPSYLIAKISPAKSIKFE
ncbi:MAG TPA: ABC transporter permease [Bacteroidales bacterium]|nr:ABC transporter permease [Bacteroidales bacterium]